MQQVEISALVHMKYALKYVTTWNSHAQMQLKAKNREQVEILSWI